MQNDPGQASHMMGNVVIAFTTGLANAVAWAQSINVGAVASGLTVIGAGIIGLVVLGFQRIGPEWIKYKTARDDARNSTLSGKMDTLTEALNAAVESKELARQTAADARELAEVNRALAVAAEKRNAELMAELAKLARRLEDANHKLHATDSKLQSVVFHNELAEQQADTIIAKLDRNAGLTTKVDDKASHISETVDDIASKPVPLATP